MKVAAAISELRRRNAVLFWVAAGHLLLALLMLFTAAFDHRTVLGLNLWIKPIKFALSIAIYVATFGWLLEHLQIARTTKRRLTWTVAITMLVEIIAISGQAARGVRSHFNLSSPLNGMIFGVMGLAITINTLAAAYVALKFWILGAPLPAPYLLGIRFGFSIFVLATMEGFVMAGRLAHSVHVPDGGPGLPFVNWSTRGGDLRIAHFLGMHALQILPLLGYALTSRGAPERTRWAVTWTTAISVIYGVLVLLLFLRALAGRPLF